MSSQEYEFLVKNQGMLIKILERIGIKDPSDKIKNLIEGEGFLFDVLDSDEYGRITKIRKKGTGEIFERGTKFYVKKYDAWITVGYFDETLTGEKISGHYYTNYLRADYGGLYRLDEISLTDKEVPVYDFSEIEIL
jgi:hypothetical protein